MAGSAALRDAATVQQTATRIEGRTASGWGELRDAFAGSLAVSGAGGAALCVYQAGRPVADLAGGVAGAAGGRRYTRDTLQPVMSVSKGIVAIAVNMLAGRGVIDLDAPVARYWPEFAQAGKQDIPVRWLLTHQAGLAALDRPVAMDELLSWTPVITALEKQAPNWPPGTAHGYHSMSYGFLLGELIRRTTGRFPGEWIAGQISGPLGADAYLGLPARLRSRTVPVLPIRPLPRSQPSSLRMRPGTLAYRAAVGFTSPPLSLLAVNEPAVQAAQLPAANGIGSARGLARIFAAVIGEVDGVRLMPAAVMAEARREQVRGPDLAATHGSWPCPGPLSPSPSKPVKPVKPVKEDRLASRA